MLEFGQYISFVVLVIVGMITDFTSKWKTHVATCPGYMAKSTRSAVFYSVTKSKVDLETLAFGQDINFVGTNDYRKDFRLTSTWETRLTTCRGYMVQVPGASFFFRN